MKLNTHVSPVLFLLASTMLLTACGGGSSSGLGGGGNNSINHAPQISSVAISPVDAKTTDTLTAAVSATDPNGDAITYSYEWLLNGVIVSGQTGVSFPAVMHKKGDVIKVIVIVSDGTDSVTAEASATIQDSSATFSVSSVPTVLNYGEQASFSIDVQDPDGDAVGQAMLDYGPAGMALDSATGVVSWTASGPMFGQSTTVNWQVSLAQDASQTLSGSIQVNDPGRSYPLMRTGVAEIPVKTSGLVVSDFDADGDTEILVASKRSLYIQAKSATGYAQEWMYPFSLSDADSSRAVTAGDVDGDGKQEIFLALGQTIKKFDGKDRRLVAEFDSGNLFCHDLEFADLDNDGGFEVVCLGLNTETVADDESNEGSLVVLNADSLVSKMQSPNFKPGRSIAVGNVDADANLEIVAANGRVFDGGDLSEEWNYGLTFGADVETGDLDGDGVEEIIGAHHNFFHVVRVYSATEKSPLWEIALDVAPAALRVGNLDGDNEAEIVVGDSGGKLSVYEYDSVANPAAVSSYSTLLVIPSQGESVSDIAIGDVDADGAQEIVWGSGGAANEIGDDVFVVASLAGPNPEWKSTDFTQPVGAYAGGRLVATSAAGTELMFISPKVQEASTPVGTHLIGMDPATGLLDIKQVTAEEYETAALNAVDHDQDGVEEVLLAAATTPQTGFVGVQDFAANAAEILDPASVNPAVGEAKAVAYGDLTGDGFADMVAITNFNTENADEGNDGHVYVYDIKNQTTHWVSTGLYGGVDIAVADLDNDGKPEMIAASDVRVLVYATAAGNYPFLEKVHAFHSVKDLLVADTDTDGAMEIYVLAEDENGDSFIHHFDNQLSAVNNYKLDQKAVSLHLEDVGSGNKNLVINVPDTANTSSTPSSWFSVFDPGTGTEIWKSPAILGEVPINSLHYVDANNDGAAEAGFGTSLGMYLTQ